MDRLPPFIFFFLTIALSGILLEFGYRLGGWRHTRAVEEKEGPVNAMVGSILGLLAIMLAFTFSFAASRYDARREAVLLEANGIGTAYLRAQLLPDPQRSEIRQMLREYVDVRVQAVETGSVDAAIVKSTELQNRMWERSTSVAERNSGSITVGLFIQSLNDVIDLHTRRLTAGLRSRIPVSIWIALFGLSAVAMVSIGYQSGLSATRRSPAMLLMVLATAAVLHLIVDLDRADEGFLRINQQAMLDLQTSMKNPPR